MSAPIIDQATREVIIDIIDAVVNTSIKQFWKTFDSFCMDKDRLAYMRLAKDNGFSYEDCEPDMLISRFCRCSCSLINRKGRYAEQTICSRQGTNPKQVAETFTYCFGDEIICKEASQYMSQPQNIIDCLDIMYQEGMNPHAAREMIIAFTNLGHKRA